MNLASTGDQPQVFKSYALCDTHTLMKHDDDDDDDGGGGGGGGGEYPGLAFGRGSTRIDKVQIHFYLTANFHALSFLLIHFESQRI